MIEVKNLSKKYGTHLAVEDVSFTVNDGEVLGLLGLNGAGKSTIMNIMTGYISMTTGSVSINGYDILEKPLNAKKHIGYLPEIVPLYPDMTVKEYLYFLYDLKKVKLPRAPHIDEICRLVKLENVFSRLIKNLSKGYRQRVGIASALIGNPDVIILDEPTVGLDPRQIIEIRSLIHNLGKNHTVIVSSHILSEIQSVCDRVIVINNGRLIADGKPKELSHMLSNDVLKLRVKGTGSAIKTDVIKTLTAGDGIGIREIIPTGSTEENCEDFSILPIDGTDIREEIIKRLVGAGVPILSLSTAELDLEQIFLSLTDKNGKESEE